MLEAEQVKLEPIVSEVSGETPKLIPLPRPTPKSRVRAPLPVIWREVRVRLLPLMIFISAVLGVAILWRQWVVPQGSTSAAPAYVGEPAVLPLQASDTVAGK